MTDEEELRILRRRLKGLEDAMTRRRPDLDPGGRAMVVRTVNGGAYPGGTQVWFAVQAVSVTADDSEGAAVTLDASGDTFFAANLGSANPPVGTNVVAVMAGGYWCFRWDG